MICDAAKNTHLGMRATTLLKYYAGCGNGFRPALSEIRKHTGIAPNKISEIRKELVGRVMISYEPQSSIVINWEIIQIFAGLPEPLPMRGSRYYFKSINKKGEVKKLTMGQLMKKYRIRNERKSYAANLTEEERNFFKSIAKMTVEEYRMFSIGVLGMEPPPEEDPQKQNLFYPKTLEVEGGKVNTSFPLVGNEPLPF